MRRVDGRETAGLDMGFTAAAGADHDSARNWVRILARYREPSPIRSTIELAITALPFAMLVALALWAQTESYWLAAAISALNGAFMVRLFIIQHDCGHYSFFRDRKLNDWVGRVIGVLTLTPYDVWRKSHSVHHASAGNLDRRGMGDIPTLTVAEYTALPRLRRIAYRVYRHPVVLFGVAPAYLFLLQYRLPIGLMGSARSWLSAMATNLTLVVLLGAGVWVFGPAAVLVVFLPTVMVGATVGIWLFYVQHQFEHTHWAREESWQIHDAALAGSSHYVLPPVLRWLTGNIGIHHVHHLYARIPFYRLPEVLREHPALARVQRMTLRQSFACACLHLWDESESRLLSFAEARAARTRGPAPLR